MSVFDPIITMVRPNRNISSDSSESWKATADEDVKDMKDKENSLNDNDESETGSTLSSVMGVKLDPHQMVILSGNLSKSFQCGFSTKVSFFVSYTYITIRGNTVTHSWDPNHQNFVDHQIFSLRNISCQFFYVYFLLRK